MKARHERKQPIFAPIFNPATAGGLADALRLASV